MSDQSKHGPQKRSSGEQEKAKGFPAKKVGRLTPKGTGGKAGMSEGVSEAKKTNNYQKLLNEESRKRGNQS